MIRIADLVLSPTCCCVVRQIPTHKFARHFLKAYSQNNWRIGGKMLPHIGNGKGWWKDFRSFFILSFSIFYITKKPKVSGNKHN